jgi:hypothetical protein
VGFHRYFNSKGELVAVADYTRSDYEWNKDLRTRAYRDFYVKLGRLGTEPEGLTTSHRFREVYRVQVDGAERVSFSIAGFWTAPRRWYALDPASTVRQWTEPGMQGSVMLDGEPAQIQNKDFQYQSFAEVYQRRRLGIPGTRAPREYNSTLLDCPVIDEAMQLGLEDPRFRFEPVTALTE